MHIVRSTLNEKLLVGEPVSVEELRKVLNKKILNFEFIKIDGDVRPAKGTTMMKYVPTAEQPTGENPSSDKVAAFYDLDKNKWRSVSNRSKEIVLDVDKETGKPKISISDKIPKTEEPADKLMPKEKDVEQRPVVPKSEPTFKPSIVPDDVPEIPTDYSDTDISSPDEEKPLDIHDKSIPVDNVKKDDIIVTTNEPDDIEEPLEPKIDSKVPEQPSSQNEPLVRPSISGPQPAMLPDDEINLPPKEEITFPEDDEFDEEDEEDKLI